MSQPMAERRTATVTDIERAWWTGVFTGFAIATVAIFVGLFLGVGQ